MEFMKDFSQIKKNLYEACLLFTNKVSYFLAISAGKIAIDSVDYFATSTNSPIGQQLLGEKVEDKIPFDQAKILKIFYNIFCFLLFKIGYPLTLVLLGNSL